VGDQAGGRLSDHHFSRGSALLESSSDAQHLAGYEALAGEHLPGLDADPHLERHTQLRDERLVQHGDRRLGIARGSHGPKNVVLVGDRRSERRDDGVADVLLNRASVPLQDCLDRLEIADEDTVHRLRVERRGESHRVDDVGEENRHNAPRLVDVNCARRRGHEEGLVLVQDGSLEGAQLGARFDPELLHQCVARVAEHGQRVRLPSAAVERKHQQGARAFSEGVGSDHGLELRDELDVPAEYEVRLEPTLDAGVAQLLEPCNLDLRERLVREVREWRPAPERETVAEALGGPRVLAEPEGVARVGRERREPIEIEAFRLELEHVARWPRGDRLAAECLAKLRDVDLDRVARALGRLLAPQVVDEAVD
jgi:hypothetical protein